MIALRSVCQLTVLPDRRDYTEPQDRPTAASAIHKDMSMATLRVYVSDSCAGCDIARALIEYVRRLRLHYPIELINLDDDDAVRPPYVFGTPTYCLDDQIISLGNPSAQALLAALDREAARAMIAQQSPIGA